MMQREAEEKAYTFSMELLLSVLQDGWASTFVATRLLCFAGTSTMLPRCWPAASWSVGRPRPSRSRRPKVACFESTPKMLIWLWF